MNREDLNLTHEQAVELDMAQEYLRNKLQGDDLAAFEEHLLVCEECQNEVARLDLLIQALRKINEQNKP